MPTTDRAAGRLRPCPDTPNCVSTFADDDLHGIEPLGFSGSAADAKARLLSVIHTMPRATVVTDEETYLHVEFRSRLFRFVDDIEFLFDKTAHTIHFRSASRIGRSDLGVNRRRMEEIRERFQRA